MNQENQITENKNICNQETEIFSRVTGYHRPLKHWNVGKQSEFKQRKVFKFKIQFKDNVPIIESLNNNAK